MNRKQPLLISTAAAVAAALLLPAATVWASAPGHGLPPPGAGIAQTDARLEILQKAVSGGKILNGGLPLEPSPPPPAAPAAVPKALALPSPTPPAPQPVRNNPHGKRTAALPPPSLVGEWQRSGAASPWRERGPWPVLALFAFLCGAGWLGWRRYARYLDAVLRGWGISV